MATGWTTTATGTIRALPVPNRRSSSRSIRELAESRVGRARAALSPGDSERPADWGFPDRATPSSLIKDRVDFASRAPLAIHRGQGLVVNGGWFLHPITPRNELTTVSIAGLDASQGSR